MTTTEKTIEICGRQVPLLYSAATETGYEQLSCKQISVFLPQFGKDKDGNVIITQQPTATTEDYLHLVVAAVVAANEKERHIKKLKPEELPLPIDSADLLYNATKTEITQIIATVLELRNAWYEIPAVMKQDLLTNDTDDEEKPKN